MPHRWPPVWPPHIRGAHCVVEGAVGREIRFRLLLPDEWNRKFMMGGGGGFVGGIDNQAVASINAGYATSAPTPVTRAPSPSPRGRSTTSSGN